MIDLPSVYGRDLRAGTEYDIGQHRVSQNEILEFARVWDPLAIHVEPSHAAAGRFGGVIASGIHTVAVFQRLSVARHFRSWSIVAGRSIRDVRFSRPVRPGDTLVGSFVLVQKQALSDHADAITLAGRLIDLHGRLVLTLTMDLQLDHGPDSRSAESGSEQETVQE